MFSMGDSQQEKDDCLAWLVDLNGDEARMNQLNVRGKSMCHAAVGIALISFSSSHYCTSIAAPVEQLQRGARSYLQYTLTGYSDWAEHTGFLKWYLYSMLVTPLSWASICYIEPDVTNDRAIVSKLLGQGGEKLQAWHESYSFSTDLHLRVNDQLQCRFHLTRVFCLGRGAQC